MKALSAIILCCLAATNSLCAQSKDQKKLAKLADDHKTWEKCWIITLHGDTVYGYVKPAKTKDTSTFSPATDGNILFANQKDVETVLHFHDLRQLYVPGAPDGYRQYYFSQGPETHKEIQDTAQRAAAQAFRSMSPEQRKAWRKQARIQWKHHTWTYCEVIMHGDTLSIRLKPLDPYAPGSLAPYTIRIAYSDESEKKLQASEITAIIFYNGTKYMSLDDGGGYHFFKVLVDGRCQLVYNILPANACNPCHIGGTTYYYPEKYYVYYQGLLTRLLTYTPKLINITSGFKKRCGEVFADCPAAIEKEEVVIEKVENGTYSAEDLKAIVTGFNQCLDSKSTVEQKK